MRLQAFLKTNITLTGVSYNLVHKVVDYGFLFFVLDVPKNKA